MDFDKIASFSFVYIVSVLAVEEFTHKSHQNITKSAKFLELSTVSIEYEWKRLLRYEITKIISFLKLYCIFAKIELLFEDIKIPKVPFFLPMHLIIQQSCQIVCQL